ncbi:hypothetical protein GQX74_009059 [Glossina fuscipes]|nr:hypothetical protein GQX74_009059 [Glossina fuscipes]
MDFYKIFYRQYFFNESGSGGSDQAGVVVRSIRYNKERLEERLSALFSQQYQQQQANINNNFSNITLFSSRENRVGCVSRFRSLRILEFRTMRMCEFLNAGVYAE